MLNPFGPQREPGLSSYVNLKKRMLQTEPLGSRFAVAVEALPMFEAEAKELSFRRKTVSLELTELPQLRVADAKSKSL